MDKRKQDLADAQATRESLEAREALSFGPEEGPLTDNSGFSIPGSGLDRHGPFVRSPYNYDVMKASNDSALHTPRAEHTLTVQDQVDEVDINTIVRRFGLTGKLPENPRVPEYGDFTGISDYQTALAAVMQADDDFMALPADLRSRFDNDAGRFVDFCLNEENRGEMAKLGLLKAVPVAPGPIEVRVVSPDETVKKA